MPPPLAVGDIKFNPCLYVHLSIPPSCRMEVGAYHELIFLLMDFFRVIISHEVFDSRCCKKSKAYQWLWIWVTLVLRSIVNRM